MTKQKQKQLDATNKPLGRLHQSIRYNREPYYNVPWIRVTETFAYDAAGRIEEKVTDVHHVGSQSTPVMIQSFTHEFEYNQLDQLTKQNYPICDAVGCGPAANAGTSMSYSYGAVTGLSSTTQTLSGATVATFGRHPNGMRSTISHANGVTDTVAEDPSGMARPRSFKFSGFDSSCPPPAVSITPSSVLVASGSTATLTANTTGDGPFVYEWFQGGHEIPGATGPTLVTPPITQQQTFRVKVTNGCGHATSAEAVVTVQPPPPAPYALVATGNANGTVTVTWATESGAEHYIVERSVGGSAFDALTTTTNTAYTDTGCPTGSTCVYRAVAVAGSVKSSPSNADLATILAFSSITPGVTDVAAAHWEEIRTAVNAMRAAAGQASRSWTQMLPSGVPPPQTDDVILGVHVTALRGAMNDALVANGLLLTPYQGPIGADTVIALQHLLELRERSR